MEFEQYLERNILTFLDSKIQKKESSTIDREEEYGLYLTKDYLKELTIALENDELSKAKKLFDELKSNYSRLPKTSIERKKIYSLLEMMYQKIQEYVRIKEGRIDVASSKTQRLSELKTIVEEEGLGFEKTEQPIVQTIIRKEIIPVQIFSDKPKTVGGLPPEGTEVSTVESNIIKSLVKDALEEDKEKTLKEKEDLNSKTVKEGQEFLELQLKKKEKHKHVAEPDKKEDIPDKVLVRHHGGREETHVEGRGRGLEDIKDEIIGKTAGHIEQLKNHVTGKLLEELRTKLGERDNERDKKIDALRRELIKRMIEELNKRFEEERHLVSEKLEHLRAEILDRVFRQARQIVSSNDNQNNVVVEHYHIESSISDLPSIERSDVVRFVADGSLDKFEEDAEEGRIADNRYSGDELRIVYEQAVYYMFDNKYDEAAKLFRKIIGAQPSNKAAKIRLQECMEKNPGLSGEKSIANDSEIESMIKNTNDQSAYYTGRNNEERSAEKIEEIKSVMDDNIQVISEDINEDFSKTEPMESAESSSNISSIGKIRHKRNNEEVQRMYEEAIYTMFQSNYEDAAKTFQEILRVRPDNKAARIRLQECIEAINNA